MFYFDEIYGKKILKSDLLVELNHFFTTRELVIKSAELDMQQIVERNKNLIKKHLNTNQLICPTQTHSANIAFAINGKNDYPDTDALVLNNKNQAIFLNFADCTPVILYDKKQHLAAIAHAGWKGTAQKIVPKTVEFMNSNPQDIITVIGPTISLCCYEIKEDVYNQLKNTVQNSDNLFKTKNGKIFADLKAINSKQLEEIGVCKIDICPYCTSCDNHLFYSYRKENGTSNRHSAVIKL